MPYKDKAKQLEYQRKWMSKRNREKGIPPRKFGIDKEKRHLRQSRWRYGKFAKAHRMLVELLKELNT